MCLFLNRHDLDGASSLVKLKSSLDSSFTAQLHISPWTWGHTGDTVHTHTHTHSHTPRKTERRWARQSLLVISLSHTKEQSRGSVIFFFLWDAIWLRRSTPSQRRTIWLQLLHKKDVFLSWVPHIQATKKDKVHQIRLIPIFWSTLRNSH